MQLSTPQTRGKDLDICTRHFSIQIVSVQPKLLVGLVRQISSSTDSSEFTYLIFDLTIYFPTLSSTPILPPQSKVHSNDCNDKVAQNVKGPVLKKPHFSLYDLSTPNVPSFSFSTPQFRSRQRAFSFNSTSTDLQNFNSNITNFESSAYIGDNNPSLSLEESLSLVVKAVDLPLHPIDLHKISTETSDNSNTVSGSTTAIATSSANTFSSIITLSSTLHTQVPSALAQQGPVPRNIHPLCYITMDEYSNKFDSHTVLVTCCCSQCAVPYIVSVPVLRFIGVDCQLSLETIESDSFNFNKAGRCPCCREATSVVVGSYSIPLTVDDDETDDDNNDENGKNENESHMKPRLSHILVTECNIQGGKVFLHHIFVEKLRFLGVLKGKSQGSSVDNNVVQLQSMKGMLSRDRKSVV